MRNLLPSLADLRPPSDLLNRLRWFFLVFAIFFVVTFLPQLTAGSTRPVVIRVAASVLLVTLGLWYWRGYIRASFPAAGLILECIAFMACTLTVHDPFKSLGLLYIAVNFRSLYGSRLKVISFTLLALATFVAGVIIAAQTGSTDRTALLAYTLPGVPVLALISHLVAVASERAERATDRAHLLARSGIAITMAGGRSEMVKQALETVTEILNRVAGARADIVRPHSSAATASSDDAALRTDFPMRSHGKLIAELQIHSAAPLSTELSDALSVLTAQLALAMDNEKLTNNLRYQADHDPLTDLANRAASQRALNAALTEDLEPVGVLLLDLDGFKAVNDTLGHGAGDQVLIEIALRMKASIRDQGTVARLGGDEFVVYVRRCTVDAAQTTATELMRLVTAPIALTDQDVRMGCSIGIALSWPGCTASSLLHAADTAMYLAKKEGKGRVRLNSSTLKVS